MQDSKFFRVKKITLNNGITIFKVYGYTNRLERFLTMGCEYSKDNITFFDALDQIENLISLIPKKITTVYSVSYSLTEDKKTEKLNTEKLEA